MRYNGRQLRHEQKYLISHADRHALAASLEPFMKRDPYSVNGGYFIRSLYLDDIYSSAYNEKSAGIERRRKHRVRIYNCSDGVIKYEVKDKFDSYISKVSSRITPEQCRCIMKGDMGFMAQADPAEQALMLGLVDSRTRILRPKVVVDYDREAFVCEEGNVRVTFDSRLRAGFSSFDIFDPELPTVPALEPDRLILEVKYDDFLPGYIRSLLRQLTAWQTSQSKYAMCVDAKNRYYRKDVPFTSV